MIAASPEIRRISAMYDYLVAPASRELPDHSEVEFVFGRKSSHLVKAAAEVAERSGYLVVSGNVGKDSGDLPLLGVPEADFVINGVLAVGAITPDRVRKDTKARNGLNNAVNGIDIIRNDLQLPRLRELVTVQHPVQTRRLGGTFAHQAERAGLTIGHLTHYPTSYNFDPANPYDQFEAAGELLRVHNLSQKGEESWLARPDDLDSEMVEFARSLDGNYQTQFQEYGIINPSTADNTDRAVLHTT